MDRRRFLALSASLAAGAGCSRFEAPPDDTVTPVPSPETSTTGATSVGTVTVESATVQPGYVGPNSPDSIGVFADAGQYLVAWMRTDGSGPPGEEFAFRFDGETHRPTEPYRGFYRDEEWAVRYREGDGPLLFALPASGDASDARLTWPGGEWAPGEGVRRRLAAAPATFRVSLDGPATVGPDDDPTVAVTVRNESERAGRYVLALNRTGPRVAYAPVARLSGILDSGGSTTHEFDAPSPYEADPPRETTYRLDAPRESQDATLTVCPATTPTPTDPVTDPSPTGTPE